MQSTTQPRLSGWIWPVLSLVLAVLLLYISYQNLQLKKELNSVQDQIATAGQMALPRAGAPAPPFDGRLSDGTTLTLRTDSLTAPVILAWLSPDCEPCLEAVDGWNSLADRYPGRFRGILRESGQESDACAFAEHDVRFRSLHPFLKRLSRFIRSMPHRLPWSSLKVA